MVKTLLHKADYWSYEQEWRVVRVAAGGRLIILNRRQLVAIVFGASTAPEHRAEIRARRRIGGFDAALRTAGSDFAMKFRLRHRERRRRPSAQSALSTVQTSATGKLRGWTSRNPRHSIKPTMRPICRISGSGSSITARRASSHSASIRRTTPRRFRDAERYVRRGIADIPDGLHHGMPGRTALGVCHRERRDMHGCCAESLRLSQPPDAMAAQRLTIGVAPG